jgi:hypothetical protein
MKPYERYRVDERGIVIGIGGFPGGMEAEIGALDEIMERYFALHREKYGRAARSDREPLRGERSDDE